MRVGKQEAQICVCCHIEQDRVFESNPGDGGEEAVLLLSAGSKVEQQNNTPGALLLSLSSLSHCLPQMGSGGYKGAAVAAMMTKLTFRCLDCFLSVARKAID